MARSVRLVPDSHAPSQVRFTPEAWGGRHLGRPTPDGYHLIVAPVPGLSFHLLLPGPDPPPEGTAFSPLVDFDPWHAERAATALAFWRFAQAPRTSRAARVSRPKPDEATLEAAFLIWALDMKTQGASYRDIAEAVYGATPRDWSDTANRGRVRRLLDSARQKAASAYRFLLKPRRPPFGP